MPQSMPETQDAMKIALARCSCRLQNFPKPQKSSDWRVWRPTCAMHCRQVANKYIIVKLQVCVNRRRRTVVLSRLKRLRLILTMKIYKNSNAPLTSTSPQEKTFTSNLTSRRILGTSQNPSKSLRRSTAYQNPVHLDYSQSQNSLSPKSLPSLSRHLSKDRTRYPLIAKNNPTKQTPRNTQPSPVISHANPVTSLFLLNFCLQNSQRPLSIQESSLHFPKTYPSITSLFKISNTSLHNENVLVLSLHLYLYALGVRICKVLYNISHEAEKLP
jgi:hypothetical protein